MYFTHTYTHIYIKYTLKVLVICSICGRNWGFSFQSVIIMKTGQNFHVEKENYDTHGSLSQKDFEEGKNVTQAYPASAKHWEVQHPSCLIHKKRRKIEFFESWQKMYVPEASNIKQGPKVLIGFPRIFLAWWLRRSKWVTTDLLFGRSPRFLKCRGDWTRKLTAPLFYTCHVLNLLVQLYTFRWFLLWHWMLQTASNNTDWLDVLRKNRNLGKGKKTAHRSNEEGRNTPDQT